MHAAASLSPGTRRLRTRSLSRTLPAAVAQHDVASHRTVASTTLFRDAVSVFAPTCVDLKSGRWVGARRSRHSCRSGTRTPTAFHPRTCAVAAGRRNRSANSLRACTPASSRTPPAARHAGIRTSPCFPARTSRALRGARRNPPRRTVPLPRTGGDPCRWRRSPYRSRPRADTSMRGRARGTTS
jgi:hypothetical protein